VAHPCLKVNSSTLSTNILTDAAIQELIAESKPIPAGLHPLTKKAVEHNRSHRREFEITGANGGAFVLSTRENLLNPMDFSVILSYKMPGFNTIFRLRRYNGKSHIHTNTIENETVRGFHIHAATERYQRRGSKEDSFATTTTRYFDLESAVKCMLTDCGFPALPEDPQSVFNFGGSI
jgi:hypothetical protein